MYESVAKLPCGEVPGNPIFIVFVSHGSATPGRHAKSGTLEGFAWQAKQFHAQANLISEDLTNLLLNLEAIFSAVGSKVTQLRYFLPNWTSTDVKTFIFGLH